MNASGPSRVLLSTLLYATLVTTTIAVPLMLASRDDIGFSGLIRDAAAAQEKPDVAGSSRTSIAATHAKGQVWDRYPGFESSNSAPKADERAIPRAEVPAAQQPEMRRPRADRSGPDSEMIRAGKVRTKTIRA